MVGHIRKRGKSWELCWFVSTTSDGKKKYQTKTVHGTKKEAEAELSRVLATIHDGTCVAPAGMTVAEFSQRWLTEIKGTIKKRTWEWYASIIDKHVLPRIGYIQLSRPPCVRIVVVRT